MQWDVGALARDRQREGWEMGEGWMEGWANGGTAICLCVLTHCPPQRPNAQIRRSDTPANCNTWEKLQPLHREIRRWRDSTWQDFYGKILVSYYSKSWSGASVKKSAPSPLLHFALILVASMNCGCSWPTASHKLTLESKTHNSLCKTAASKHCSELD